MASGEGHKQQFPSRKESMFSEDDMLLILKNEHILSNKNESLDRKICALITTWGELASLETYPTQEDLRTLGEFVKSHTLQIVLSATWSKYKEKYYSKLVSAITRCHNVFYNYKGFQKQCFKIKAIVESPWRKKLIIRFLNNENENPDISDEEYNFFAHEESGYIISLRLTKLCEDGCEDMALNLLRAYIRCCEWAKAQNKSMFITEDQRKFIYDVYFALLYQFDHTSEMSRLFKYTTLPDGVDMIRRFAFKDRSVSKIWINSIKIAQLAGTIFLTKGVMLPLEESRTYLIELLNLWLPTFDLELDRDDLLGCLRRIMKNAMSAPHMYFFSNHLTSKYGFLIRNYNVEIFIQALNTDLNLLEKIKTENENGSNQEEVSLRIANGLLDLSNLLIENIDVSKECVLSAFSLRPTEQCLKKIEEMARASGHNVLDTGQWKCKFHPPATLNDELLILCDSCGDFMAELKVDTTLKAPNIPLGEALKTNNLGLSEQLRDDLVVIIFCARYQLLSWLQNWTDLHRLCIMYLDDPIRTKNLITELKFLEIDYTPFLLKRESEVDSVDQYESQIEQVMTETYPEVKRKKKRKRVISSGEEDDDESDQNYLPHQKSDPDVLKSLRNFRRTLKKEQDFESDLSRKKTWYDYSTTAESSQSSSSTSSPLPAMTQYEPKLPVPQHPISYGIQLPQHQVSNGIQLSIPPDLVSNGIQLPIPPQQVLNGMKLPIPQQASNGIQIRKDIFDVQNEHFKAFFREGNGGMAYLDAEKLNALQSNFSEPPVIQEPSAEPLPESVNGIEVGGDQTNAEPKTIEDSVADDLNLANGEDKMNKSVNNALINSGASSYSSYNSHKYLEFNMELLEKHLFEDDFCNNNTVKNDECVPTVATKNQFSDIINASESMLDKELVYDINPKTVMQTNLLEGEVCKVGMLCKYVLGEKGGVQSGALDKFEDTSDINVKSIENASVQMFEELSVNLELNTNQKKGDTDTSKLTDDHLFNSYNDNLLDELDRAVAEAGSTKNVCSMDKNKADGNKSERSKDCEVLGLNNGCEVETNKSNFNYKKNPDEKEEKSLNKNGILKDFISFSDDHSKLNDETISKVTKKESTANQINVTEKSTNKGVNEETTAVCKKALPKIVTDEEKLNAIFQKVLEVEKLPPSPPQPDEIDSTSKCTKDIHEKVTVILKENCDIGSVREKLGLKECRVVLNRLKDWKVIKRRGRPSRNRKPGRQKVPKEGAAMVECKVFSDKLNPSDENFNTSLNTPLQIRNHLSLIKDKNESSLDDLKRKLLVSSDKMNPRVVLKRLDDSCIKSLLAGVPGILDTNLFRPENTDQIVNVVQIAGGRTTSTVQSPNTQTSTQVSPHIQRIGQPRNEKNDQSSAAETTSNTTTKSSANTYTVSKPVSTQSPTLINILSQQIIRPSNSSNTTRRTAPLINILSQQTIRPANTTLASKTTTTITSDSQSNNTSRIIATSSEQQQQILNQIVNPNRTAGPLKTVVGTSNSEQGRIVQFICKSTDGKLIPVTSFPSNRLVKVGTTQAAAPDSPSNEENFSKLVTNKKTENNELSEALPKFQQAFGKSVYQNNVDSTNSTNVTNNVSAEVEKNKIQVKSTSVSVQPLQGSVIYTRQMPVGQTINLIPQTRGQVFRIATTNSEQISLVKDTVIHSKMSALLAAALQGKPKNSEVVSTDMENSSDSTASATTTTTRVQLTRPTLVQNARIVKPVLQIPSNVIRNTPQTNLSSTTLEQLREFDRVYKQVKERSSTSTPSETAVSETTTTNDSSPQRISVTYLNQSQKLNCAPVVVVSSYNNLQPAASPALSVASQGSSSPCVTPAPTPTPVLPKVATKSSKGKSVKNAPMHASKTSPIPKPQQKPQEDEHTTQRIFDILAEYAEQLRNSPDLNNKPAPRRRSNPPTNPSQNSKRKKSSSSKKSGQCSSLSTEADVDDPRTIGSEDSSCGVVQLSMQDEEQTPTAASTSESNDSTVTTRQQLILTDSSHNQTRNLIIADSSVGEALKMPNTAVLVPGNYIMPVSMVKGGQQIAVVSGGSKILATVPARSGPNMLLFQSFLNQNRKTNVPTVKYSSIQPISGISSQTLTGVSAQPPVILPPPSHGISTVTLGQPIAIKKIDDSDQVNTELLLTISQSRENSSTTSEDTPQPDSSTSVVPKIETVDLDENTVMSDNSSEKAFGYQKPLIATPIATPVIAQTIKEELSDEQTDSTTTQTIMTLNINPLESKGDNTKVEERVQSVLVSAGSSNGPMLSHSPPQYKQSDCSTNNEPAKDDFLRNGGKRIEKVQQGTVFCMQTKSKKASFSGRLDREVQQICMQRRQAAIERELRLQKSLSEECEDLGVDEPSTSDLFPEALLFDSNNSPSFDQTSQDLIKRPLQSQEKEEGKLTLFSDDDFMFEQYQTSNNQLCYEEVVDSRLLSNGQGNETVCEDNTLLQTCTSMSDVTLSSPISPDTYSTNTPPPLNKYMHKYTNKKKNDRMKQIENWTAEVSSSEDTTGSSEIIKSAGSPDICLNKRIDEETTDGSFKVVRLSLSKPTCDELHCADSNECSLSGRGARKSVKKQCSCCNGAEDSAVSRKRPSSQPQASNPHKKAFPNKKR